MTGKYLWISADGRWAVESITPKTSYVSISTGVGGWIERVRVVRAQRKFGFDFPLDMWVNENGRLDCLPLNAIGTDLYCCGEPIVGHIVLTGGTESDGSTAGLTDEQIGRITETFSLPPQAKVRWPKPSPVRMRP